jgi:hypothetical protein
VILDPPDAMANVTAKRDGKGCAVSVTGNGTWAARPLVITVDEACSVALDAEAPAASAIGTRAPTSPSAQPRTARAGCCGAQATPGSTLAMALVVLAMLLAPRATSRARARCAR